MAAFLNTCRFNPTAGGATDWTVSSAVTGYKTPAGASAVNGRVYKYRAESADLSQWEEGEGAYTVSGTVLARTTVFANSSGTTSKINFSAPPQVAIVAMKEDLLSIEEANSFTTAQQSQARSNIGANASTQSAALGANVALNNMANFFDGPSLTLAAGTWFVTGGVTVTDTAGAALFNVKLWDGASALYDSRQTAGPAASFTQSVQLASVVVLASTTTVKISARDLSSVNGFMLFNQTGNSKDCSIHAVRVIV